jgi:hypothetical protein
MSPPAALEARTTPVQCVPFLWAYLPGGEWRSYWRACTVLGCQACGKPSKPGSAREEILEKEKERLDERQQNEAGIRCSKSRLHSTSTCSWKSPVQAPPGTFPEDHDPKELQNLIRTVCDERSCVSVDTLFYKGVEYPNIYSREVGELVREGTTENIGWYSTVTQASTSPASKIRRGDEAPKCPYCCFGFPNGCSQPDWIPC